MADKSAYVPMTKGAGSSGSSGGGGGGMTPAQRLDFFAKPPASRPVMKEEYAFGGMDVGGVQEQYMGGAVTGPAPVSPANNPPPKAAQQAQPQAQSSQDQSLYLAPK